MLYVFYITTTPYLPCNNKNINRKELYDFYYTAITLTTGYKTYYTLVTLTTGYNTFSCHSISPNGVLKPVMGGSWVHKVLSSQLLNVAKALELGSVNDLHQKWMQSN